MKLLSRATNYYRRLTLCGVGERTLVSSSDFCHRTEENIIKSNTKLEYPKVDCFTFFSDKFLEYGDATAIVDETSGERATFNDIVRNARKLASFFNGKGYSTGERIAINVPNCLQYAYGTMGTLANGMVLNTANHGYTGHELNVMLKNSQPRALLTSAKQLDVSRKGVDGTTIDSIICLDDVDINDSGVVNLSDILANGDETFKKDLSCIDPKKDTGFLLYSSGTTGLPKGVMVSHSAFISNILQLTNFNMDDVPANISIVLPMYHIYGLNVCMMFHLYLKSTLHVMESFVPEKFLSVIEEKQIERVPIVPPIALFMMNHPMVQDFDLSSITSVFVGAAPMDELATTKFYELFPNAFMQQGYGLTETNVLIGQPRYRHLQKAGSCGMVYADTMCKVVSLETGEALGPNEEGEMCVKGPQIMNGYLDNAEATSATIDADGWLRTGDLGYYDDDLQFYIIDRLKELIKYKALQVAPAELEDLLVGHEEIMDACVIGVPCGRAGEIPRAYVVKKEDSNLTEECVKEHIANHLADHKKLRGGVQFVDALPKSPAGKLLRRILKDEYLAESTKNI